MSDDAPDWRKATMLFAAGDPAMLEDFPDWVKGVSVEAESSIQPLEGDYTVWVHKWTEDVPGGLYTAGNARLGMHVNDATGVITLSWVDGSNDDRFGRYNISDFFAIFESAVGEHYSPVPWYECENHLGFGYARVTFSFSLKTYVLITIYDQITWKRHEIQVWRELGKTPVWSRDILADEAAAVQVTGLCISPTGKYIALITANDKIMLYEGS